MVVWSSMNRLLCNIRQKSNAAQIIQRCMSGHKKMTIEPSRWQWHKFKDMLHMYAVVGMVPCLLVAGYCNLFIGPAQLTEIPEGYTPKHWEYHQHPITRFIARYFQTSYQQEYEKYMHFLYEEDEKSKLRLLTQAIKDKMSERHDYQAWYYTPITAKFHRQTRQFSEETKPVIGENSPE
ncbi:NADH dehydrogenase [ubiquinone] 1 beta subcomplex subunit 5, mitochondrial [Macrosteles quadrilineatus]|uniref:NADH dehydrogenase [ubiquinone] 1 beta subcomplex subunit 5, mitochondrial n=1 Tax=Macrosteles quadrilineatus TaxID=74068 RepID=UPI0023E317B8|nr:NADH dehydrogenase [ubiquinone] 1 beta subcomplex subunit 5, mitochondrial [Macrosteles quadrilineatus]